MMWLSALGLHNFAKNPEEENPEVENLEEESLKEESLKEENPEAVC